MAFKVKNICNKPSLGRPSEGFEGEFRKSWSVFTTLLCSVNYQFVCVFTKVFLDLYAYFVFVQYAAFAMAALGVAGANAALSPLLSSFGSSMLLNSLLSSTSPVVTGSIPTSTQPPAVAAAAGSVAGSPSLLTSALQQQV